MGRYTILVTLGSSEFPFVRLRDWLIGSPAWSDPRLTFVVQSGATPWPHDGAEVASYVPASRMRRLFQEADLVISHAGVGSLIETVRTGTPALFAVRRRAHGEHVDDHQLQIASTISAGHLRVVDLERPLQFDDVQELLSAPVGSEGGVNERLCSAIATALQEPIGRDRAVGTRSGAATLSTRVVDLLEEDFQSACAELSRQVAPWAPTTVVAIATGGVHVAKELVRYLPDPAVPLETVLLQRPGTRQKERFQAERVLSRLPRRISDALRRLEVAVRERRQRSTIGTAASPPPTLPPSLADRLSRGGERVLVVDDTVDSGRTLAAVVTAVEKQRDNEIRTAALTVTFQLPIIEPDYLLYRRTLLRLPWSKDVPGAARRR